MTATKKIPAGLPAVIAGAFLNLLFPPVCEVCGCALESRQGHALCDGCVNKMRPAVPACIFKFSGVRIWSAYAYEPPMKECVHLFKYKGRTPVLSQLGGMLADFAKNSLDGKGIDAVIPVPLHKSRLRERGFNQSELLAKKAAAGLERPLCRDALRRVKYTLPQAGLSRTRRRKNVSGAFAVTGRADIERKNILLVDDVLTTGSTLMECAKAISRAGAASVQALVLARGV